jgi:hypothetical protein
MATSLGFKDIIDLPAWRPESVALSSTTGGATIVSDLRNDATRHPFIYFLRGATTFDAFEPTTGDWLPLASPALTGTFGSGATSVFNPSQGPRGKILAGSTSSTLNLDGLMNGAPAAATWTRATTTATVTTSANHNLSTGQILTVTVSSDVAAIVLGNVTITVTGATTYTFACLNAGTTSGTLTIGAQVGANQLANRGDGIGFRIRVVGSSAGSSGKIEERTIIANTLGAAPVLTLDSALSFTPATGDSFEIISGRVFLLSASTTALGCWKYYDVATNSYSGNLAIANLPATITTDSCAVALSELHVSNDRVPGSGLVAGGSTYNAASPINCILATDAGASSITGSGMPDLFANEYRNFQVRIVEDTAAPTSVGQRRKIASHTAGVGGVFTLSSAWGVTPSATAKFVIENDNDKIILRSSATTAIYNYNILAGTWDTSTWAVPVANGGGVCASQAFGITRDITGNARHSQIFFVRGNGTAAVDILDISGAATGTWLNDIVYGNKAQNFSAGTCAAYDPATLGGRFLHINVNATQRMVRFDMRNRIMDPGTYLRFPQGAAVTGGKMASALFIDGATKLQFVYLLTSSQVQMFSLAIQR